MILSISCANIGLQAERLHQVSASLPSPSVLSPLVQASREVDFYVIWERRVQQFSGMKTLRKECVFSQLEPKEYNHVYQMRNRLNLTFENHEIAAGKSVPRQIIFASHVSFPVCASTSTAGVSWKPIG